MPSKNERAGMRRRKPKDIEAFVSGAERKKETGGRKPPDDYTRINANIPTSLYKRLKIKAVQDERTMTQVLESLIRRYVDK